MTTKRFSIQAEYDDWIINLANEWLTENTHFRSYYRLLRYLQDEEFTWSIDMDSNRAADGQDFRLRFADETEYTYRDVYLYLSKPCSVLEMMVALSSRCEEQIAGDPDNGLNPGRWLVDMLLCMGVYGMTDGAYSEDIVRNSVTRMLNREYKPNGDGGLFKLKKPWADMRTVEIWYQLAWYLNEIA